MDVMANDLNRFRSDTDSFAGQTNNLRTLCRDLATEFDTLQDMWEGEARDALKTRFSNDFQSLEQLVQYMESISNNLKEALQTYTTCEGAVSASIDSLRI